MKKPGEHIRVNFGQEPFIFSIDTMVKVSLLNSGRALSALREGHVIVNNCTVQREQARIKVAISETR